MRLLITGAGGLLGGRLALRLNERFQVLAGVRGSPGPAGLESVALELRDERALGEALRSLRPDAVVHAATLNVEPCEREPELAEAVNVRAAQGLARACRRLGLGLVALSTDLVFDGTEPAPVDEEARARPLSVYGRTKLLGEGRILDEHPDAAVVRVALVYGAGHGSRGTASETVAWALRAGRPVQLYRDQFRAPIDARSLADLVGLVLERGGRGVYHAGGPERLSRLELGLRTAQVLGLDPTGVAAADTRDQPQLALRPLDVALGSARATRELGWRPRSVDETIRGQRDAPDA